MSEFSLAVDIPDRCKPCTLANACAYAIDWRRSALVALTIEQMRIVAELSGRQQAGEEILGPAIAAIKSSTAMQDASGIELARDEQVLGSAWRDCAGYGQDCAAPPAGHEKMQAIVECWFPENPEGAA